MTTDGLLPTEQWAKENVLEDYQEWLIKSIMGMKGRMSRKYSEGWYISRFHRKRRPVTQWHAVEQVCILNRSPFDTHNILQSTCSASFPLKMY